MNAFAAVVLARQIASIWALAMFAAWLFLKRRRRFRTILTPGRALREFHALVGRQHRRSPDFDRHSVLG